LTAQGMKEAAPAGGFRRPPSGGGRKRDRRPVLPGHIQWRKRCFWCLFAEDPGASGAVPPLFPRMLKDLAELSRPPFSFLRAFSRHGGSSFVLFPWFFITNGVTGA